MQRRSYWGMVSLGDIWRITLPPQLIIDDFIEEYGSVSYEDYLTEFVNNSMLFSTLSKGQIYSHTPKERQNDGECDCCSKQYELDFKLLGTQSGIYAKRNLSLQQTCLSKGVFATHYPRQNKGMEITLTSNLLRRYSVDELLVIDNLEMPRFDRDRLCPEADVKGILKIAKCKKNVVYFYTDFFCTNNNYPFDDIVEMVESHINECLVNLFKFRDRFVTDKDTFFAAIIQGYFCFAVWENGCIQFKEHIPLSKSPLFVDLYRTLSSAYTSKLIIK